MLSRLQVRNLIILALITVTTSLFAFTKSGVDYTTYGSWSDVKAAYADATTGTDTIHVPIGTYTWGADGASLGLSKAVNLLGAGQGSNPATATIINLSTSSPANLIYIGTALTFGKMTMNAGANGQTPINVTSTVPGWRITEWTWDGTGGSGVVNGSGNGTGSVSDSSYAIYSVGANSYGLVDQSNFVAVGGSDELIFVSGSPDAWTSADGGGTANALYVEDCTFNGQGYVCDINFDGRAVFRRITINQQMKIDGHGTMTNGSKSGGTARSVRWMEIYQNNFTANAGAQAIIPRGGNGMVWGNAWIGSVPNYNAMAAIEYGATAAGANFGSRYIDPNNYPVNMQCGQGQFTSMAATSMVVNQYYQINSPGTTSFTSLGAANNNAGTQFVYNGTTVTGSGTVYYSTTAPMYWWNNTMTSGKDWDFTWTAVDSGAITQYGQHFLMGNSNTVTATTPGASTVVQLAGTDQYANGTSIYVYVPDATPAIDGTYTISNSQGGGGQLTINFTTSGAGTKGYVISQEPSIMHADQDYFKQIVGLTFTGKSGVGSGTKAQMLAITPTKVGVGFWVTDEASWDTTLPANTSGQFYVWDGTAWVLKYTPYTYPHPLRNAIASTNHLSCARRGLTGQTN